MKKQSLFVISALFSLILVFKITHIFSFFQSMPSTSEQNKKMMLASISDSSANEAYSQEKQTPAKNTKAEDNTTKQNNPFIKKHKNNGEFPVSPQLFSQEEIKILQNLMERRNLIEQLEKELNHRETLLQAAENRIEKKIHQIKNLKNDIEKMIEIKNKNDEIKIKRLVKVYENMKPKKAALIWNKLDMDILLEVALRMKELKTADVMAQMSPEQARALTQNLAKQKKINVINDQLVP